MNVRGISKRTKWGELNKEGTKIVIPFSFHADFPVSYFCEEAYKRIFLSAFSGLTKNRNLAA
jgi:hypothetical protein